MKKSILILIFSLIFTLAFQACINEDKDHYRLLNSNEVRLDVAELVENTQDLCSNDADDDNDGDVDCEDSECKEMTICNVASSSSPIPEIEDSEAECSDGIDNDFDSLMDCADIECQAFTFCKTQNISSSTVNPDFEDTSDKCQDTYDNDGDGFKDCADKDCKEFIFCKETEVENPEKPALEDTIEKCSDNIDNDNDGAKDCVDEGCKNFIMCQEVPSSSSVEKPNLEDTYEKCRDEIDNDFNGYTDCEDENCKALKFCKQSSSSVLLIEDNFAECTNKLDDDDDGLIDCQEEECKELGFCQSSSSPPPTEMTIEECSDDKDNDNDGLVDCSDDDCAVWAMCVGEDDKSLPSFQHFLQIDPFTIPGIVEAEDFIDLSIALDSGWNFQESSPDVVEPTTGEFGEDVPTNYRSDQQDDFGIDLGSSKDGGAKAGADPEGVALTWIRPSEIIPYAIELKEKKTFRIQVRAASGYLQTGGTLPGPYVLPVRFVHPKNEFIIYQQSFFEVEETGGWYSWDTFDAVTLEINGTDTTRVPHELTLDKGQYIFEVISTEGAYNINYFEFLEVK